MINHCLSRVAADSEYVLIAERFFSGVLHPHLLGVRDQDILFPSSAAPWGWRGRAIGVGGRSGDATALTLHQAAKVRRDGVKDAGETGAGAATTGRVGGDSSECDRLADFLGHKALLCVTQSGRRMDWRVGGRRRGPRHRGSCEAGAGAGARVNIMALVAEK